jgi:cell division transport system ATP-binding protein
MEEASLTPVVSFRNTDIIKEDSLIISNLSMDIQKSDFVYLIGKVGTGKTSIVKAIIADTPLKDGEAFVAGYDLLKIKPKQVPMLRRKIGVVFQDFQLLTDRSVYENMRFVLMSTGWKDEKVIDTIIMERLESVGLQTKAHKKPHQLSGGEQQRAAIARALLNEPEIILADEPTGNLDSETATEIMELLLKIHRQNGPAIIIVTHNKSLIERYPGRVFLCEDSCCREVTNQQEIYFSLEL